MLCKMKQNEISPFGSASMQREFIRSSTKRLIDGKVFDRKKASREEKKGGVNDVTHQINRKVFTRPSIKASHPHTIQQIQHCFSFFCLFTPSPRRFFPNFLVCSFIWVVIFDVCCEVENKFCSVTHFFFSFAGVWMRPVCSHWLLLLLLFDYVKVTLQIKALFGHASS
jgi:hypothetical protein